MQRVGIQVGQVEVDRAIAVRVEPLELPGIEESVAVGVAETLAAVGAVRAGQHRDARVPPPSVVRQTRGTVAEKDAVLVEKVQFGPAAELGFDHEFNG